MRHFSKNEKLIINKILELAKRNQTNCAYNLFFDIEGSLYGLNSGFDIRFDGKSEVLYIDSEKYRTQDGFRKVFWKYIADFYEFVFLMNFLVENEYIAIAEHKPSISQAAEWYSSTDFLSDDLKEKLTKYFECYIYPTNNLFELKRNNFRLEEELKQDRQFWITTFVAIAAVIVAFIPFITGLFTGDGIQKIKIVEGSTIVIEEKKDSEKWWNKEVLEVPDQQKQPELVITGN